MANHTQHRRLRRKSASKKGRGSRKMRGGGCGCAGSSGKLPFFSGGADFGSASFANVPIKSYYPLNHLDNDPLRSQISARNLPNAVSGGGSRRKKAGKKGGKKSKYGKKITLRRLKGGSDYSLGNQSTNPITNFGSTIGSSDMSKLLYGNYTGDSAVYNQPINNLYGSHNPPLV